MSNIPAGGYGSKQVTHTRAPKTEPIAKAVRPGSADMLGQAMAYEPPDLYDGEGYNAPPRTTPWSVGVGIGRTVMSSGSQGTHGSANPGSHREGAGEDILSEFGPDVPGRR
jgi:hypothetical protein